MRGGSPYPFGVTHPDARSVPRARGFTHRSHHRRQAHHVCSPCAGVHPGAAVARCRRISLFPVRGGSPTAGANRELFAPSVPRARGFTPDAAAPGPGAGVCSPCAGVHPASRTSVYATPCLFPVRGGSPSSSQAARVPCPSVPRARGFTHPLCLGATQGPVCSPCAGVHPTCTSGCRLGTGLFPVRGGSPTGYEDAVALCEVCSPCAGVHLRTGPGGRSMMCLFPVRGGSPSPRSISARRLASVPVRGGSPWARAFHQGALASVPRTRGFTREGRAQPIGRPVCSPCAGVHRRTPRPS